MCNSKNEKKKRLKKKIFKQKLFNILSNTYVKFLTFSFNLTLASFCFGKLIKIPKNALAL